MVESDSIRLSDISNKIPSSEGRKDPEGESKASGESQNPSQGGAESYGGAGDSEPGGGDSSGAAEAKDPDVGDGSGEAKDPDRGDGSGQGTDPDSEDGTGEAADHDREPGGGTASDADGEAANPASGMEAGDGQSSETDEDMVTVVIEEGVTSYSVCQLLEELGLVEDADSLDYYICSNSYSRSILQGTYKIRKGTEPEEIVRIIMGNR